MKFKNLGGQHVDENEVSYLKGDTIESDTDLSEKFPNKFERLHDDNAPRVNTPSPEPVIPGKGIADDPDAQEDAEALVSQEVNEVVEDPPADLIDYGEDVTGDFNCEPDIHVFCKANWCTVMDEDGKPINETKLRRKAVQAFIDDLYEEVPEEGDGEEAYADGDKE